MNKRPYNYVPGAVMGMQESLAITEEDIFKIGVGAIVRYHKEMSNSDENTTKILRDNGLSYLLETYGLKSKEEDSKKDAKKLGERVVFIGKLERLPTDPRIAKVMPEEDIKSYTITLKSDMASSDIEALLRMYGLPEPVKKNSQPGASSYSYRVEGVEFKVQVYTKRFLLRQEMQKEEKEREREERRREEMSVRRRERTGIQDALKRLTGEKQG